jgi:ribosome-associated protein
LQDLFVRPGLSIPERELVWSAVRASGPGGQNVNKVASKVELRFDFEGSAALTPPVKQRLRGLSRHRLDAEGRILVVSQLTRNQAQNLTDARRKLAHLIEQALLIPKRRRATKPSRAAKRARVADKRAQSRKKQSRGAIQNED